MHPEREWLIKRKLIEYTIIILITLFLASLTLRIADADAPSDEVPKEPTVEELIVFYANSYKLDPDTMLAIAYAESRYKNVPNYLYDGENGYRTAYGIFQITRSTYRAFCGNPDDRKIISKNIECAMKIASTDGLHHWSESGDW